MALPNGLFGAITGLKPRQLKFVGSPQRIWDLRQPGRARRPVLWFASCWHIVRTWGYIQLELRDEFTAHQGKSNMTAPAVRRADFLMALAYATDLATGHSRDFALRSCVLAMRFTEVSRLDEPTRRSVYHQALLRYIGCNADTHLL